MSPSAVSPSEPRSSQAERWEIADQLDRVLISPWFRTSSRCSTLLRHVVTLAINEQADRLKERQIAIEAFHRKSTYDNNTDPVVRVAAGEVRKRLAQYYGIPENAGQVRIVLPVGSYVPIFHFPARAELLNQPEHSIQSLEGHLSPENVVSVEPTEPQRKHLVSKSLLLRYRIWFAFAGVLILLAVAVGTWRASRPSPMTSGFDAFWAPVLSPQNTPLISVGELRTRELTFEPDAQRTDRSAPYKIEMTKDLSQGIPVERIAYIQSVARVASVFGARGKAFDVRDQSDTTFADFSGRTAIFLGSYDNDWSVSLSQRGRFQFQADYTRNLEWISDRDKPGEEIGALTISSTEPATYDAFSIVMRETGVVSGQKRLVLAGVGDSGTIAAAEFVSNPKYLNDFAQHAPKGWANRNIEFLIQTRVIENVIGIPRVVDYSIW